MTKFNFQNTIKNIKKTDVLAVLVLFLFSLTFQFQNPNIVKADEISELNEQINQAREQLSKTQHQKSTLQSEVAAFDSQIYLITLQINQTQAQLNKTQREIDETLAKIKQAEDDLMKQKEILRENIKVFYVEGQVSSIEVIASSDNFSEYMDRSEYLRSLQDKIIEAVGKINVLKKELEIKKKELETKKTEILTLKNQQLSQKGEVDAQRSAKDVLLRETKGLESNYQKQLGDLYARRTALSRRFNEGSSGGGSGGYPYAGADPDGADPWNFYYRQCTSYVAWRSAIDGPVSGQHLREWGSIVPTNGEHFDDRARSYRYPVDSTPRAGSIMVFPLGSVPGAWGHVAFVDKEYYDNTGKKVVDISEYNYLNSLGFGKRTGVNPADYGALFIHPK